MVAEQTKLTTNQTQEMYHGMVPLIGRTTMAYRAAVVQKMLEEANYFDSRLKLPTPHPIKITDLQNQYTAVDDPWSSVIHETNGIHYPVSRFGSNIYNAQIPREARLRALEIAASGTIETSNFVFYFYNGRVREVMRIATHEVERYARHLDELVGQPSLIDQAQAKQLATQWLTALGVEPAALASQKATVNQLRYLQKGTAKPVTLPLYYVDFGAIHFHFGTNAPNMKDFDEPVFHVEILGTTKELQDITINDGPFSGRPLLLIHNAIDLAEMPDPPPKYPEISPEVKSLISQEWHRKQWQAQLNQLNKELEELPPGATNDAHRQEILDDIATVTRTLKELKAQADSSPQVR
jgi:hypothetical protein